MANAINLPMLVQRKVFADHRGHLSEIFNADYLWSIGIKDTFVQANHVFGNKNVLRGLHYQIEPFAQAKLVTVLSGSIFEVAVDINPDSINYQKNILCKLIAGDSFYVPRDHAHGLLCLEDNTHVVYFCSQTYSPDHCIGIPWNDSTLDIPWPCNDPILSDNDKNWSPLEPAK